MALNLPNGYLSNSQIETYLGCGYRYKMRYLDRLHPPVRPRMVLGRAAHKALEAIHVGIKGGKPITPAAVLKEYTRAFDKDASQIPAEDWEEAGGLDAIKASGVALVDMYRLQEAGTVAPVEAESWFDTEIAGVRMKGVIDLVEEDPETGEQIVTDFKVTTRSAGQSKVDNSLQLTLYSAVTGIATVGYTQLIALKRSNKIEKLRAERTPADREWLEKVILSVAESISAGRFVPANPADWMCTPKSCEFWGACRGYEKVKAT